mmetsp:Transcript_92971/g.248827  ORF Transcript_92971/g.248827 Transcript_92971/m.248827 type:complete len:284 (+) Transcript_92971:395-1246(+)
MPRYRGGTLRIPWLSCTPGANGFGTAFCDTTFCPTFLSTLVPWALGQMGTWKETWLGRLPLERGLLLRFTLGRSTRGLAPCRAHSTPPLFLCFPCHCARTRLSLGPPFRSRRILLLPLPTLGLCWPSRPGSRLVRHIGWPCLCLSGMWTRIPGVFPSWSWRWTSSWGEGGPPCQGTHGWGSPLARLRRLYLSGSMLWTRRLGSPGTGLGSGDLAPFAFSASSAFSSLTQQRWPPLLPPPGYWGFGCLGGMGLPRRSCSIWPWLLREGACPGACPGPRSGTMRR